jgi:hypothetical protein
VSTPRHACGHWSLLVPRAQLYTCLRLRLCSVCWSRVGRGEPVQGVKRGTVELSQVYADGVAPRVHLHRRVGPRRVGPLVPASDHPHRIHCPRALAEPSEPLSQRAPSALPATARCAHVSRSGAASSRLPSRTSTRRGTRWAAWLWRQQLACLQRGPAAGAAVARGTTLTDSERSARGWVHHTYEHTHTYPLIPTQARVPRSGWWCVRRRC